MPRAIWKGSISFGLVQIPVGLYPAEKTDELHLSMLDRRDLSPIRFQRINEASSELVPWEEVVKGYKTEEGSYVVLTKEDLERANVKATQTMDIVEFVEAAEVEPIYFERPYYLAPTKQGRKAYALLRETLKKTDKVGIAKVVIRTRQHIAALLVRGDALLLQLLRYAHEIRGTEDLEIPSEDLHQLGVSKREIDMAAQLVEGMLDHFRPQDFRDDYREDLMRMIEEKQAKGEGEEINTTPVRPRGASRRVIDIVDLLKKSLEEKGGEKKAKPARKAKRTPTKKRARKHAA